MSVNNNLPSGGGAKVVVHDTAYQIYQSGNTIILNMIGVMASQISIPVDILPPERIVGFATFLDNNNKRYSGYCNVHPDVQATGTHCTSAYITSYANTGLTNNSGYMYGQVVWAKV